MNAPTPSQAPAAYNVASFCRAHGISRAHFYNLCRRGEGPRIMNLVEIGRGPFGGLRPAGNGRKVSQGNSQKVSHPQRG